MFHEIKNIENKFYNENKIIEKGLISKEYFSGSLFAVFNTEKDAKIFKNKIKKNNITKFIKYVTLKNEYININQIHVSNANEPSDIIWQNYEYTYGNKLMRIAIVNIISLGLMISCFFGLYTLTKFQINLNNSSPTIKLILSTIFSIVINCINFIASKILISITE